MLDGNDRAKLSALEKARRAWAKEHGSMLWCERAPNGICSHMHGAWLTGCQRKQCIADDPEYIKEQKRIERQRRKNAALKQREEQEARARKEEEKKSYEQKELEAIAKLEAQSRQAFYDNDPELGETLFNRARFRRGELRKHILQRRSAHD